MMQKPYAGRKCSSRRGSLTFLPPFICYHRGSPECRPFRRHAFAFEFRHQIAVGATSRAGLAFRAAGSPVYRPRIDARCSFAKAWARRPLAIHNRKRGTLPYHATIHSDLINIRNMPSSRLMQKSLLFTIVLPLTQIQTGGCSSANKLQIVQGFDSASVVIFTSQLNDDTEPIKLITAIWSDGTVIWSENREKGGEPYLVSNITQQRAESTISTINEVVESLETNRDFRTAISSYSGILIRFRGNENVLLTSHEFQELDTNANSTNASRLNDFPRQGSQLAATASTQYRLFRKLWTAIKQLIIDSHPNDGAAITLEANWCDYFAYLPRLNSASK